MFTRCPFPPESYDWDERIAKVLGEKQLYFVKPGNSALWPPTNGFEDWVRDLLERGKGTLCIGGCTLNSCVRVSAIETKRRFEELEVIVDLALCGARRANYIASKTFGGVSSVESAVRQMQDAGVVVVHESR